MEDPAVVVTGVGIQDPAEAVTGVGQGVVTCNLSRLLGLSPHVSQAHPCRIFLANPKLVSSSTF